MKVLFDQGVPVPLRGAMADHDVATSYEMGWARLSNGDLLRAAQSAFDGFITTDKNLRHQQNLKGMTLAVLVLPTTCWPRIQRHLPLDVAAVNDLRPGDFREMSLPD